MPIYKCAILVAVLAMSWGLSGGCAPAEDAEPVVNAAPAAPAPTQPMEAVSAGRPAPAPKPVEPQGINAESLVGSTWSVADYSVTFEAGGVVRFNSGSEGTWTLEGDTITISVAGEETVIQVEDDRLMHNGMALERQ